MRPLRAAGAVACVLVLAAALAGVRGLAAGSGEDAASEVAEQLEQTLGKTLGTTSEPALEALDGAARSSRQQEGAADEVAATVLEEYEARGDCVVARSGYLDLLGSVWGCVMQGEGWVELCVVAEEADQEASSVVVWRMDADDVPVT